MTQDLLFITKPTVTTKEAADLLGVTVQTILKKEKDGLIECVYKENWKQFGSKMFYLEDVEHLRSKEEVKGLRTKEAAELLNVAPSTIFTYIKSGKLPATKVERKGKQIYLIDEEELEIFMLDYEKNKTKERKTFLTKMHGTDIYLYQLFTQQQTGKQARVIALQGQDGKLLTEDEDILPLSAYQEHGYSFVPFPKQAAITKRGYVSFSFKRPPSFHSMTYHLINILYTELGATNMRLTQTADTIELDIKPFVLPVNPLQFQEEITYLHAHLTSGTILPHVDGVYLKSTVEPFTFHADQKLKQTVVRLAGEAGMGQEEFLLQAVTLYINQLDKP